LSLLPSVVAVEHLAEDGKERSWEILFFFECSWDISKFDYWRWAILI